MLFRALIAIAIGYLLMSTFSARPALTGNMSESELPLRTLRITMAPGDIGSFMQQLDSFADANAFAMRVGNTRPDGRHFLVQMWREDIKVIAVNPAEPEVFEIGFYQNDAVTVPDRILDALVRDLKKRVTVVQSVVVPEET